MVQNFSKLIEVVQCSSISLKDRSKHYGWIVKLENHNWIQELGRIYCYLSRVNDLFFFTLRMTAIYHIKRQHDEELNPIAVESNPVRMRFVPTNSKEGKEGKSLSIIDDRYEMNQKLQALKN